MISELGEEVVDEPNHFPAGEFGLRTQVPVDHRLDLIRRQLTVFVRIVGAQGLRKSRLKLSGVALGTKLRVVEDDIAHVADRFHGIDPILLLEIACDLFLLTGPFGKGGQRGKREYGKKDRCFHIN